VSETNEVPQPAHR